MRKGKEHYIVIGEHFRGGFRHQPITQRNQLWMMLTQEGSRVGVRCYRPDFHVGMRKQQPEQLSACIASGACHRNPHCHPHDYATHNKIMHQLVSELGSVAFGLSQPR
jgi:hypothetical protein